MSVRNKYSKSWNKGQNTEKKFFTVLRRYDPKARKANRDEQINHIDFYSNLGTFDVKSTKRVSRNDKKYTQELVWLEFKNVQGREGWLFGSADYIAFERKDDFLVVKKNFLQGLASSKCDIANKVNNSSDALYKGYQREGRKDLISLIKVEDILNLPHEIWRK